MPSIKDIAEAAGFDEGEGLAADKKYGLQVIYSCLVFNTMPPSGGSVRGME